jgi:hypothetical protein
MIGYLEFIPIFLLVIGIIIVATHDAQKRGLSYLQLILLRFICLFTFPVGLILYLLLRPRLIPSVSGQV